MSYDFKRLQIESVTVYNAYRYAGFSDPLARVTYAILH